MSKAATYRGYKVRSLRGDQYANIPIEDVRMGERLDMGVYGGHSAVDGNPNTWDVKVGEYRYTETRGATVRVWI